MSHKIWVGADHAGFPLKEQLVAHLLQKNWEVIDLGTDSGEISVHYPAFARIVCENLMPTTLVDLPITQQDFGLLICGSGQGMSMAANRYPWIRAALVWTPEVASLAREHNNANVLCLGSRLLSVELAKQCLDAFLTTSFAGGRHQARIAMMSSD